MINFNVNPVAFSIGPISVRWYGLMYVVGITVGLLVAWPCARWKGFTHGQLEKVVYWAVPAETKNDMPGFTFFRSHHRRPNSNTSIMAL